MAKQKQDYGKNERRIHVDQFQVPYYCSFVPHDYVANETFKLLDMMCNLPKHLSALDIDIDEFDGNPINYRYFIAIFKVVEIKIPEIISGDI